MLSLPLRGPWIALVAAPILAAGCHDSRNPVDVADSTHPSFRSGTSPSARAAVTLGIAGTAWAINSRGQVVVLGSGSRPYRSYIWDRGTLTDLGTLGQGGVSAFDINARGQIVGTTEDRQGRTRAFLWERGRMRDLGAPPWSMGSYGRAIDDAGRVVGYASPGSSFLWHGGRWTALPPAPGDEVFIPQSISNSGAVVGYSQSPDNRIRPAVWKNGVTRALPTPGGVTGIALDVNGREQIVGYSLDGAGNTRAMLWQAGTAVDLGTLGGDRAIANAINERGQIVGSSRTASGAQHAFLWQNGVLVDLGPGTATGINERGDVVGESGGQATLWPTH